MKRVLDRLVGAVFCGAYHFADGLEMLIQLPGDARHYFAFETCERLGHVSVRDSDYLYCSRCGESLDD